MLPVLGILLSLPAMDVLEHFWLTRININWELLDFVDTGDINHQVLASLQSTPPYPFQLLACVISYLVRNI